MPISGAAVQPPLPLAPAMEDSLAAIARSSEAMEDLTSAMEDVLRIVRSLHAQAVSIATAMETVGAALQAERRRRHGAAAIAG